MAGWMDIGSIVPYHRPLVVASLGPYGTRHMKPSRLLPLLFLLVLTRVGRAVSVGSSTLRLDTVWTALLTGQDSVAREVILDLRLPRALNAFTVGGLLALSGVLMQVLLRNSLADPYVLGISGGAAVAALGAMLLGLGGLVIDWAAGIGALGATLLVFALAHARGGWTPQRLLLNGVGGAPGLPAGGGLMLPLGVETPFAGVRCWLWATLRLARFSP